MSYDHRTVGFEEFDQLKLRSREWLEQEMGDYFIMDYGAHSAAMCSYCDPYEDLLCEHSRRLRIAIFRDQGSDELMVAEEWLAVEDHDCDGTSVVKLAVYRLGHRPRLVKQIVNPSLFESNPELFRS